MEELRSFKINVDGRVLSVAESGMPDGVPVFIFHGTPGSKLIKSSVIEDAKSKGIRLISHNRPGYGDSTPQPGRTIASVAGNVKAIMKELDLDKILLWGISGGGPHALACAALLPDQVAAAAAIASPAPFNADGLDWFSGMGEDNIIEFNAAIQSRESMKKFVKEQTPGMLNTDPEALVEAMKSILCPADVAAMDLDLATYLINSTTDGISKQGDGWVDDDIAFTKPWGFSPEQISIPLLLMHGEQDQMVPFSHGEWLAHKVSNVETRFSTEDGHLTLKKRIPEVHDWLLGMMKE